MGAGAVVAIIAAAHAQRLQDVSDAFRLAGATAPERGRTLEELRVSSDHGDAVAELAKAGVLVEGSAGRWHLSESAVVARRDAPGQWRGVAIVVALLAVGLLALILALGQRNQ